LTVNKTLNVVELFLTMVGGVVSYYSTATIILPISSTVVQCVELTYPTLDRGLATLRI